VEARKNCEGAGSKKPSILSLLYFSAQQQKMQGIFFTTSSIKRYYHPST